MAIGVTMRKKFRIGTYQRSLLNDKGLGMWIISCLLLLMPSLSIAQMTISKVGEAALFSSCILDRQTYLAVGDLGKIYRTEDGGKKWSTIPSPVTSPLFCIRNVSKNTLFISGANGVILKSTNGGKSWQKQNTGISKQLFSLSFYGESKGIALGDWGAILYTENGGETWQNVSWKEDIILYGGSYIDENNVWIVGEIGLVLRSANGGKSWTQYPFPVQSTLTAIDFNDKNRGIIVGIDGVVFETQNSGKNWQRVTGLPSNHFFDVAYKENVSACVGDYSVVLERSSTNWIKLDLPTDLSILWLSGVSINKFDRQVLTLAVGKKGIIVVRRSELK